MKFALCRMQGLEAVFAEDWGSEAALEVLLQLLVQNFGKEHFVSPQAALPDCFPGAAGVAVLGFSVLTSRTIKSFL